MKITTGDESWVSNYDPETKQKFSQFKLPSKTRPKKELQSQSNYNYEAVVHHEYTSRGQAIN